MQANMAHVNDCCAVFPHALIYARLSLLELFTVTTVVLEISLQTKFDVANS